MKWRSERSEMSQVMSYTGRHIIPHIEREPGPRRVVGRITWCIGIILEPRVPPKEGRSGENSQGIATRTQERCRLSGPGEDLRGEPREWRKSLLLRSPAIGTLLNVWRDPSSDPSLRPAVSHRDRRRAEGLLEEIRRGTITCLLYTSDAADE